VGGQQEETVAGGKRRTRPVEHWSRPVPTRYSRRVQWPESWNDCFNVIGTGW
jgi:hypothetical protein